ncbi:hypothetical protein BJX70DRAFT_399328 [Aspergillus crustosus]
MVVNSDDTAKNRPLLMEHLQPKPRWTLWDMDTDEDESHLTDEADAPFGWKWARASMDKWKSNAPAHYMLRQKGYVFWDEQRVRNLRQFETPRGKLSSGDESVFPVGYRDHASFANVEEALMGYTLHERVMREIAGEIDMGRSHRGRSEGGEGDRNGVYEINWRS